MPNFFVYGSHKKSHGRELCHDVLRDEAKRDMEVSCATLLTFLPCRGHIHWTRHFDHQETTSQFRLSASSNKANKNKLYNRTDEQIKWRAGVTYNACIHSTAINC
jgi:hypothetical protein